MEITDGDDVVARILPLPRPASGFLEFLAAFREEHDLEALDAAAAFDR